MESSQVNLVSAHVEETVPSGGGAARVAFGLRPDKLSNLITVKLKLSIQYTNYSTQSLNVQKVLQDAETSKTSSVSATVEILVPSKDTVEPLRLTQTKNKSSTPTGVQTDQKNYL